MSDNVVTALLVIFAFAGIWHVTGRGRSRRTKGVRCPTCGATLRATEAGRTRSGRRTVGVTAVPRRKARR